MQVGDLIISVRELIPDLPRTLAPIGNLTATIVSAPGSTLPPGTYDIMLTATNRWGETLPSAIVTPPVVGANVGLQITGPTVLPVTGSGWRAYYALHGQPLTQFQSSPTIPFTISAPGAPGTPPNRSTAFYPDSDGNRYSAYTLYRWLNEALETASMVTGGIPDTSGVNTIAQQGQYVLPGRWKKLWHCWYNGFPVAWAGSQDMFYRNKLSGISWLALIQQNADQMVMELQPQPDRTGGQTTLAATLNPGDTIVQLTSAATFYLALGLAQIGNEIIAYSGISGSNLTGISRGMGGTPQQVTQAGAAVSELNFRFNGLRIFDSPEFFPGMSTSGLAVPPGWKRPLIDYIVSKSREGEQSVQDAKEKLAEFTGLIKQSVKGNEQVAGPRQVGGSTYPGDAYPTSGGFGIIVR